MSRRDTPLITQGSRSFRDVIACAHAYDKHVVQQGEFPGITSRAQFQQLIQDTIEDPTAEKSLSNDRHAYWNGNEDMVVITDPTILTAGRRLGQRPAIATIKGCDK